MLFMLHPSIRPTRIGDFHTVLKFAEWNCNLLNPLNSQLNTTRHLLELLPHYILHVSRIRGRFKMYVKIVRIDAMKT